MNPYKPTSRLTVASTGAADRSASSSQTAVQRPGQPGVGPTLESCANLFIRKPENSLVPKHSTRYGKLHPRMADSLLNAKPRSSPMRVLKKSSHQIMTSPKRKKSPITRWNAVIAHKELQVSKTFKTPLLHRFFISSTLHKTFTGSAARPNNRVNRSARMYFLWFPSRRSRARSASSLAIPAERCGIVLEVAPNRRRDFLFVRH